MSRLILLALLVRILAPIVYLYQVMLGDGELAFAGYLGLFLAPVSVVLAYLLGRQA